MKKTFTFVELIISLIIISILSTLGINIYTRSIEDSKHRLCRQNLLQLLVVVEAYGLQHGVMPNNGIFDSANLARYGARADIFICPGDINGAPSYQMNPAVENIDWTVYRDNVATVPGTAVVVEADNAAGGLANLRHRVGGDYGVQQWVAIQINKDRTYTVAASGNNR